MRKFLLLLSAITIGLTACKKGSAPPPGVGLSSDRQIAMTVDNSTPVVGANVSFTLIASNSGPDATTGVSVSDALPAGYTLVSATATIGNYASGAWGGFVLADGGSATLTIVAKVNPAGSYENTATITGIEDDPATGNNSSTVTTTPTDAPPPSTGLIVSTLAGSTAGFMEGTGAAAQFDLPRGLAVDGAGNVYVADHGNARIRKITAAGVVTTLAGGTIGFADGMGGAAKFNSPNSVAVDAAGNVYIADAVNGRIRRITPAGVVSTIIGGEVLSILSMPLGVGVDAAGNVYAADANNNRILKLTSGGTLTILAGSPTGGTGSAGYVDGASTEARFSTPNGVVIDAAGNVFVSDAGNHLIRKITPAGAVSTLAGSGQGYTDGAGAVAKFENLTGPAIDAAGNIYVGGIGNNRIRKITPAGVVSSFAGSTTLGYVDGPVATAQFANPYAVTVDAAGNVYVADIDNNRIRKIGH